MFAMWIILFLLLLIILFLLLFLCFFRRHKINKKRNEVRIELLNFSTLKPLLGDIEDDIESQNNSVNTTALNQPLPTNDLSAVDGSKEDEDTTLISTDTRKLLQYCSSQLSRDTWRSFGSFIGLTDFDLEELDLDANLYHWEFQEKCYQMLLKCYKQSSNIIDEEHFRKTLINSIADYKCTTDSIDEVQKELQDFYRKQTPQQFPWMKDNALSFDDFNYFFAVDDTSSESIPLATIFQNEDTKGRYRILMEGRRFCGKTSLLFKLAYDWGNSRSYMKSFLFVFVIQLNAVGTNVESYIKENIMKKYTYEVNRAINEAKGNALFLLDGLEELQSHSKKTILDLLTGKIFPDSSFIITKGLENSCKIKLDKELFKTRFKIKEMDVVQQKYFLLKHVFENNLEHKMKINDIVHQLPKNVRKCPMLLLLIGIFEKSKFSVLPSTTTDLFTNLFNFLTLNSEVINKSNLELSKFGKTAFRFLDEKKSVFTESDLCLEDMNNIISLGIIRVTKSIPHSKQKCCKPSHQFFLEYWAAYYLWSLRKSENFIQIIQSLKNIQLFNLNVSMLFIFLFGFLDEEIYFLLQALEPLAYYYSNRLDSLWKEIKTLEITEKISNAIIPFVSVRLKILNAEYNAWFVSVVLSKIITLGFVDHRIAFVDWNPKYLFVLKEKLKIDKLFLHVTSPISFSSVELAKMIECDEINCYLHYGRECSLDNEKFQLIKMIRNIHPNWLSFTIFYSQDKICSLILEEIENGNLKKIKLKSIFILVYIHHKKAFLSFVQILQKKPIENVYVRIKKDISNSTSTESEFIDQNDIDTFILSASKNMELKEFIFQNNSQHMFTVDLHALSAEGKKPFDFLALNGKIQLINTNTEQEKSANFIRAFIVDISSNENETLKNVLLKQRIHVIGCHISMIRWIADESTQFNCANINEIEVFMNQEIFKGSLLQCLKQFPNLQTLCLKICCLKNNQFRESFADMIMNVLRDFANLKSFELSFVEKNMKLAAIITENLMCRLINARSSSAKPFSMNTFKISINICYIKKSEVDESLRHLYSIIKKVVEPLRKGQLQNFNLLIHDPFNEKDDFPLMLSEIFPLRDGFKITWDFDGRTDGSTKNKSLLKHLIFTYRYCVRLAR